MSKMFVPPVDGQSPYPGLRPYQENEKQLFFGRDAERDILVDKLLANRLTLLFAASGVGKSSLLNAAVLPQLKDPYGENLTVVAHSAWFTAPGESVLEGLLAAIRTGVPNAQAYTGVANLPDLLAFCCLFTRHPLVLVLDQFEEFFRYQRGSAGFGDMIGQLTQVILNKDLPVHVVISMREDFALELNAFKPKLPTLLFENYYRLERLDEFSAYTAIIEPAKVFGVDFSKDVSVQIIDDLSEVSLLASPLSLDEHLGQRRIESTYLQVVCNHLFLKALESKKTTIDFHLYVVSSGRAKGILKSFVGNLFLSFNGVEKYVAVRLFDFMVGVPGFKVAYTCSGIAKVLMLREKNILPVLKKLEKSRILKKINMNGVFWYQLYHDVYAEFLRDWKNSWRISSEGLNSAIIVQRYINNMVHLESINNKPSLRNSIFAFCKNLLIKLKCFYSNNLKKLVNFFNEKNKYLTSILSDCNFIIGFLHFLATIIFFIDAWIIFFD